MRILVTGATGFVGNNLARYLVNHRYEVGLLLRDPENWRVCDIASSTRILQANLTDLSSVQRAFEEYKPDFIFHCAAYGTRPKYQKDLEEMMRTNIAGTKNLLEISEGIPLVNTGSSTEYGIKDAPMKESDFCEPILDYGVTKLAQTLICKRYGAPTLRLFSPYGPWEDPNRLIPTLIKSSLDGISVSLKNTVRDYLFIDDISLAFVRSMDCYPQIKGEIINVSSGKQIETEELVEIVYGEKQKTINISWNYQAVQTEPKSWIADIEKANLLLGWQPQTSITEGIAKSREWWKKWLKKD